MDDRLTIREFVNTYIPSNQKITIVEDVDYDEPIFSGTIDELPYNVSRETINRKISLIRSIGGFVYISVR